jgi:hypothetical protein
MTWAIFFIHLKLAFHIVDYISNSKFYSNEFDKKVSEVSKILNGLSVSQAESVLISVKSGFN